MQEQGAGAICTDALGALPGWFGLPEHHRYGIGRAILQVADSWLAERDIGFLQVKTLSPAFSRYWGRGHAGFLLRLRLPAIGGDARTVGSGPAGIADNQDSPPTYHLTL
jgi:hypothetical protein